MNAIQKRAELKAFLARHDLDLQHTCLLIGGTPALGRLQRLRRAVVTSSRLTTVHRRELNWLSQLLLGEQTLYAEFAAPSTFNVVDPEDPSILTICLISEALSALINALGAPGNGYAAHETAVA